MMNRIDNKLEIINTACPYIEIGRMDKSKSAFAVKTFEEFKKHARELRIARVKITGYLKGNDRKNSSRITLYCYVSPLDVFKPEYGEKIASISSKFSRRFMINMLEEDLAALYAKKAGEWKKSLEESGISCLVHERPFKLF